MGCRVSRSPDVILIAALPPLSARRWPDSFVTDSGGVICAPRQRVCQARSVSRQWVVYHCGQRVWPGGSCASGIAPILIHGPAAARGTLLQTGRCCHR